MKITKAETEDFREIMEIYGRARKFMCENGNPRQWKEGYPSEALVKQDLDREELYVCREGQELLGVFMFSENPDPCYEIIEQGSWKNENPYGVMHRMASSEKERRGFLLSGLVLFTVRQCKGEILIQIIL